MYPAFSMIQYEVRNNKLNFNCFLQNLKCLSRFDVKALGPD